jgi:DNA mismatch endonuclease (patch repair protein)
MMDNRTPESRSALMSRIGSKHTAPELAVRKLLSGMGYRYRLHRRDLPGKPDIVFVSRKKAIFVHGCFWHGHGCRIGKLPKSRIEFWTDKMKMNRKRDRLNEHALRSAGWRVLTVWQCEIKNEVPLREKLVKFLG